MRKVARREKEGRGFYRQAKSTLAKRNRNKLLEKVTWFRGKRGREDEEEDALPQRKRKDLGKRDAGKMEVDVKAVMFIPFTTGGKLAKSLREAEEKPGSMTGYRLRIVEKSGDKLEDLLTKSNPWQGLDGGRQGCLLCTTKMKTEKSLSQYCHTRSLVYETWCMTCMRKDEAEIEERWKGDAEKIRDEKKKIKIHLYFGETSRSVYERGIEHQNAGFHFQLFGLGGGNGPTFNN